MKPNLDYNLYRDKNKLINIPFQEIKTERLILRKLNDSDVSAIFMIRSSSEIAQFLDRPIYKTKDQVKDFIDKINTGIIKGELLYWGISTHNDSECMGTICLWNFSKKRKKADIGFELLPQYQNKGYMKEAAEVVIQFGFQKMQLKYIQGEVHHKNLRSIRLLKKLGFSLCKNERKDQNTYHGFIFYCLDSIARKLDREV